MGGNFHQLLIDMALFAVFSTRFLKQQAVADQSDVGAFAGKTGFRQ